MINIEEYQDFYGFYYEKMQATMTEVLGFLEQLKAEDSQVYEYCINRIKAPNSMKKKLELKGLEITADNAVTTITDGVGIRIICSFLSNVYEIAGQILNNQRWKIIKNKDYISKPKPNGYRSYHLVIEVPAGSAASDDFSENGDLSTTEAFSEHGGSTTTEKNSNQIMIPVEIQIRTISQDSWANLEHQMKYKKEISNRELIQQELKRCADEFASTDISMQTIKELIMEFDAE